MDMSVDGRSCGRCWTGADCCSTPVWLQDTEEVEEI